jgi:hypothetical protein
MALQVSADKQTHRQHGLCVDCGFVLEPGTDYSPTPQVVTVALYIVQLDWELTDGDSNLEARRRV